MAAAKKSPNVTLRDVAKKAGVGLATASRALRDDPATKAATREKVKQVAKKMGYRPDTGMTHLIERRWQGKRQQQDMNVGYLYNGKCESAEVCRKEYQSFKKTAHHMGYSLLEIDMSDFPNCGKLLQRLRVLGVEGLLIGVLPEVPYDLDAVCDKYPAVSINISRYRPKCPIIMHDEFTAITEVWKNLHDMGYKRIGVLLPKYPDSVSTDLRLGAILTRRSLERPKKNSIPLLYYDSIASEFPKIFESWMEKHHPDVVISYGGQTSKNIEALGYSIPEQIGYATYNLWQQESIGTIAGYFRDATTICNKGLQLLNMMVRTSRVGSSNAGMMEMLAGEWKDGETLPRKHKTVLHPPPC
ncbi:LacI family DNA-binding transcriptional regulator [Kiritimatiellota bacterium B12222]|nr:LacI family DNA-binding transcriptional regulator [Kiritimatiellota bacterium B12222]